MRLSSQEYHLLLGKRGQQGQPALVAREADLHGEIAAVCRLRGWVCFHGGMAWRTRRTPGEPDFVILADRGRTFLIEAKRKNGKLSTEQLGVIAQAEKNGHAIHVVRSLDDFLRVVDG